MKWIRYKETAQPLPIMILEPCAKGFDKYFTRNHDGKTTIRHYRQALGARWFEQSDINNYLEMLKKATPEQLLSFSKKYLQEIKQWQKFAEETRLQNWSNKSNEKIIKHFLKYMDLWSRVCQYVYDYVFLNKIYSEEINSIILRRRKDKYNFYLSHITAIDRPIDMSRKLKSLGEMALYVKEKGFTPQLKKKIKNHIKEFAYSSWYLYYKNNYDEKDVEEKIKQFLSKDKEEIIKETLGKFDEIETNRKVTEEFIKNLPVDEAMKIKVLKEYIYVSIWADERYSRIPFLMEEFLLEIGRRCNLAYNQIIQMTSEEIVACLKEGASPELLDSVNRRLKDFAFEYVNGDMRILTGEELKKHLAKEIKEIEELAELNEVEGETSFPGKVVGKIKIIQSLDDVNNFQNGDILIASCTTPSYVPAMNKASAIITNEGGILSHAAIISREMKKPCIIGTKIATQVFKDGDLVEVDATKGIVKIIRKA